MTFMSLMLLLNIPYLIYSIATRDLDLEQTTQPLSSDSRHHIVVTCIVVLHVCRSSRLPIFQSSITPDLSLRSRHHHRNTHARSTFCSTRSTESGSIFRTVTLGPVSSSMVDSCMASNLECYFGDLGGNAGQPDTKEGVGGRSRGDTVV